MPGKVGTVDMERKSPLWVVSGKVDYLYSKLVAVWLQRVYGLSGERKVTLNQMQRCASVLLVSKCLMAFGYLSNFPAFT